MSKWVSVHDRYPGTKGRYWVGHYRGDDQVFVTQMAVYDPEKTKYRWLGSEPFSVIVNVTHWMELPEPPRKEGGV